MAKSNDINMVRLCGAIDRSRLALRRFREERNRAIEQFVGHHWSELGAPDKVPVNLLALYVTIVGRNLIAKNPRLMLTTFNRAIKPTVSALETWANKNIEHTNLAETLRRVVTDALFSIGIAKVALATPGEAALYGWGLGAGKPFVGRVSLDDFVADLHAHDWGQVSFIGHRFRIPIDAVKDSKLYGKGRLKLEPSPDPVFNPEGDQKPNVIGRSFYDATGQEFEDHCELWEIYLPRHRLVVTLANADLKTPDVEPLRVQRWVGPNTGPYHVLNYGVVPDNLMPKAPIQDLIDLHEAANMTYRKIFRATDRTKEVTFIKGAADADGNRIITANDGEMIRVENPESIAQVVFGGKHVQQLVAVGTLEKDLFSFMGGNLELLGGRGPQSKTAAQDEMLNSNAGAGVADMQDATVQHASSVCRALIWYAWHDPSAIHVSEHSLPGLPDLKILRRVTPQQRQQGRFEDLDIRVDPYSMAHQTPQSRMQLLDQLMTQILVPLAPVLGQQGIVPDWNAYLKLKSQLMDMPDLADILTIQQPPQDQQSQGGPGGDQPQMPASTNRTYTRVNKPGRTQQGEDQQLIANSLGQNRGGNPEKNGAVTFAGKGNT